MPGLPNDATYLSNVHGIERHHRVGDAAALLSDGERRIVRLSESVPIFAQCSWRQHAGFNATASIAQQISLCSGRKISRQSAGFGNRYRPLPRSDRLTMRAADVLYCR